MGSSGKRGKFTTICSAMLNLIRVRMSCMSQLGCQIVVFFIATMLFVILYIMVRCASLRLSGWFRHFYLTGVIVNSAVLSVTLYTTCVSGVWPAWFQQFLTFIGHPGNQSKELIGPLPVILAILMEEIQVIRRSFETLFINSYSNSKMSLVIYLVGVVFYSSIGISVLGLAEARRLTVDDFKQLTWLQAVSVVLFMYASWKQYKTNKIMAKLRLDKNGNVTNTKHHIPHGDLFKYVSSPHFLMEILLYTAMACMLGWRHQVFVCLWLFVLTNQTIEGYLVHQWYRETFPNYPHDRKAIIPFIL